MKQMIYKGKIARQPVRNAAYVRVIARLDAALAEHTRSRSNDIEKIDRMRLAVFGCLPEKVKIPE